MIAYDKRTGASIIKHLLHTLHQYDEKKAGMTMVEALPKGATFKIKGGRIFKKGEKVRKRYKCEEVSTGRLYLFSAVYEVNAL